MHIVILPIYENENKYLIIFEASFLIIHTLRLLIAKNIEPKNKFYKSSSYKILALISLVSKKNCFIFRFYSFFMS